VVLVRRRGRIHALGERCAHFGGPLADGEVRDDAIVCPWHGSRFSLEDGRVLDGPATMPQPCFETRVRDGFVEIRRRPESGLAAA
jgi:nitrite reductase/ring-hydroxylating ferredoxin subunit